MNRPHRQLWRGDAPPYVIAQRVAEAWQREPSPYRLVREPTRTVAFRVFHGNQHVGEIVCLFGDGDLFASGPAGCPQFDDAVDRVYAALEELR